MKYAHLIWASLWRKKTRTILTMSSVMVAFLLFGLLQGINQGMASVYENLDVNRLYIENRSSLTDGLPISILSRIKEVVGVKAVTHWTYFGGFYKDTRNALPVWATDAAAQFEVFPSLKIRRQELSTMQRTRTGVIIGRLTAMKYGWKVGDRIPIRTSIWTKKNGDDTYEFEVMGIVDASEAGEGAGFPSVYVNYAYLDEARSFGNGNVHFYIASIDDPKRSTEVAHAIDALFANSDHETKTQSEQAWAQSSIQQIADVSLITNSIVGAVLFTLFILTANTMMQSVRERVPELAILKTLGFSRGALLALVVAEAIVLCGFASLLGLLFSSFAFKGLPMVLGGNSSIPLLVVLGGAAIAVLLAIVSGLPPALRAARVNIVDALANR